MGDDLIDLYTKATPEEKAVAFAKLYTMLVIISESESSFAPRAAKTLNDAKLTLEGVME